MLLLIAVRSLLRRWRQPCVTNCSAADAPYVRASADSNGNDIRTSCIYCLLLSLLLNVRIYLLL